MANANANEFVYMMGQADLANFSSDILRDVSRERSQVLALLSAIVDRLRPEEGEDSPEIGALLFAEIGQRMLSDAKEIYLLEDCMKAIQAQALAGN